MEEKNMDAIAAGITKSFKGVEIKRVPRKGGGWSFGVGSDSYGGEIIYVSPDLSWFVGDGSCGVAKLETRKNSIHYGRYVSAHFGDGWLSWDDTMKRIAANKEDYKQIYKELKADKTSHCRGCEYHNIRWVHEVPQETCLDPSF